MARIEVFLGSDSRIWLRQEDTTRQMAPGDIAFVAALAAKIEATFPKAWARLLELHEASRPNLIYWRFRMVERFARCNWATDDAQSFDIDEGELNVERVVCPLRGICKDEGVICLPTRDSGLTKIEQQVAELYIVGHTAEEIGRELGKTASTVNNQLCTIAHKLGVKTRREIAGKLLRPGWENR